MLKFGNRKNDTEKETKGRSGKIALSQQQLQSQKDVSAIKIQCLVRKYLARRRICRQSQFVWIRVYDPVYKRYFWFNRQTRTSTWVQPRFSPVYTENDEHAAIHIQCAVRVFLAKCRMFRRISQRYQKFFDFENARFYYYDTLTKQTFYNAGTWLQRQNISMSKEDNQLYQSYLKIKELEKKLQDKDKEIKEVRKKRVDDLMPQLIKDKVKNAKNLQRSKHMDTWSVDDLAAWFTELKMEEYIPYLYSNRIDGALFVNLVEDEFKDMGINNRFHLRKLELIMKSYRSRFLRKKEKKQMNRDAPETEEEDDDLLSEYAPSELSGIIAAEDNGTDEYTDEGSEEDDSGDSEEDEDTKLTEEQKLQRRMDEQNMMIQVVMQGDRENFPIVGDIVRVKYTCMLAESNKMVFSTKNVLDRPWIEFVLGIDQIIKGFDRAVPLMCIGERSRMTFTPEYAYGAKGLPPHIPPHSRLTFDVTLLGFRPRTVWVKPLIQDVTTKERPYFKDMKVSMKMSIESGIIDTPGHIFSASMILNDDPLVKEINANQNRE